MVLEHDGDTDEGDWRNGRRIDALYAWMVSSMLSNCWAIDEEGIAAMILIIIEENGPSLFSPSTYCDFLSEMRGNERSRLDVGLLE